MLPLTILFQTPIDDADKFNGYLLLGYLVMWLIGMSYMVYLYSRQRNIREDIRMLSTLLKNESDM